MSKDAGFLPPGSFTQRAELLDEDPPLCTSHRTSPMAVSALRKCLITYQLDKMDGSNPNKEDDEDEEDGRRPFCVNLNRALRTTELPIDFPVGCPVLRLMAPADLVHFPSVFHPRWPAECEVIRDNIHHIEWDPPEPEPFYQHTGYERAPMAAGNQRGKVVFCIDHATKHPYFTYSRVRGSERPIQSATLFDIHQSDSTLEFESRFESGNLQKAVQVGIYDYELTLRTDLYTKKHTQWFYFRVRNMKAGVAYRFTIVNLMKRRSLYSQGMRPLLYSETAAADIGVGWQRTGSNIRYYRNHSQDNSSNAEAPYSLTWTLQFPYDSDTCYLAHCYPYTYSRLQCYLRRLSTNPAISSFCKLRVLCYSLAGNAVYILTITSLTRVEVLKRKAVVVTARVHPGETNGSWMMEGFLDFLLGESEDAKLLRDTFLFKVVPMLNPDGVVVGNYRCSLAGRDLNRMYKTPLRDSFPSVWYTRNMVERLMAERDVILYCDFHGHNRKNNVFMYGCDNKGDPLLRLHERVFPLMMSKNASNKFSFKNCKFQVQKSKAGTGRITMWKLGIKNSYTMEATFGGSTLGDRRGTHFTSGDLKSLGFHLCDTLLDYFDPDPAKVIHCLSELGVLTRKKLSDKLGKDLSPDCIISVSDLESSTSGSDSSDSDGTPLHLLSQSGPRNTEQTPVKTKKMKKKCLKTHNMRDILRGTNNISNAQTPEMNKVNLQGSHKERNRLQSERDKKNRPPKDNITHLDPDLPQQDTKRNVQERPGGLFRRKLQVNGLMIKSVSPHANSHPGELSHVTLWHGCHPVKDNCLISIQTVHLNHRPYACPLHSKYRPHTEFLLMDSGQRRWSTQLLHLSPQPSTSTNFTQSIQQQRQQPSLTTPRRSFKETMSVSPTASNPSGLVTLGVSGPQTKKLCKVLKTSDSFTLKEKVKQAQRRKKKL